VYRATIDFVVEKKELFKNADTFLQKPFHSEVGEKRMSIKELLFIELDCFNRSQGRQKEKSRLFTFHKPWL
jgi:hypothetical protein